MSTNTATYISAAIEQALKHRINFIDTADAYGDDRSESLVPKVMSGRRDEAIVSTKGGSTSQTR